MQNTQLNGIKDLVPAAKTILVFNEIETNFKTLVASIQSLKIDSGFERSGQEVIVPICYNGEDLAQVAELQGLTVADVIRKHHQSVWNVAFIGFAPGFAYMSSPDKPFTDIPRLTVPRKNTVRLFGVGWKILWYLPKRQSGWLAADWYNNRKMWDLERKNPALLLPGMTVHFEDVTHRPTTVTVPQQITRKAEPKQSVPLFTITAPSLQMLIQDEGRLNQTNIGVGVAGAMDLSAMHSANRIVGNPTDTPVIEVLNGGLKAKMQHAGVIAVAGAISNIRVKFADGQTADFASYQPIDLDEGDEFQIQPPTAGLRNYLAVRGGIDVEPVLNSASFDSLAVLGPEPLKLGDSIYQGQVKAANISVNEVGKSDLPKAGEVVELDIVMGPRTDWFEQDSIELLCQQEWLVTNESNRVGLRLSGEQPLTRKITHELESEGTCIGALQIPPSGQPVLFMNDHPLTGGYPVIASVAKHHWDLVAQIPAGCRIKFKNCRIYRF